MGETGSKTALVTGANGFIGSHLTEALLARGYHVRCLVRRTSDLRWLKDLDVQLLYGSFEDGDSLAAACRGVDYIYHLAGAVKARDAAVFRRANTEATMRLAETSLKVAPGLKRFVFASSQAASGPAASLDRPTCETDECRPLSDYGRSKLEAERLLSALTEKLPVTVIRPPSVYGPRDTEVFLFFQWANRGVSLLPGFRRRYAHLIHVADLAEGMIQAGESPAATGKTYYLAEDRGYSWQEVMSAIARALGKRTVSVHLPLALARASALYSEAGVMLTGRPTQFTRQKVTEMSQRYWMVSSDAARRDFGFACQYDLERGARETAQWYRKEGWI
jgi:nucleoside-diphosphate-sugar epimerase